MTDREKLAELIFKSLCRHVHKSCKLAENIADDLMADGVTVRENLVAKQVVIDKKYGSVRCPSCNAVLGASSHYCWQCGQKVMHKQTMK